MNLDIMSLMAASAAVTDSPPAGTNTPADGTGLTKEPPAATLFSNILQSLKDESESDLAIGTALDAAALAEQLGPAGLGAETALETGIRGAVLPPDGNPLPLNLTTAGLGALPHQAGQGEQAATLGRDGTNLPFGGDRPQTGWFSASSQNATGLPTQPLVTAPPTGEPLAATVQSLIPALTSGDRAKSNAALTSKAGVPAPTQIDTVQAASPAPDLAALAKSLRLVSAAGTSESATGAQGIQNNGVGLDAAPDSSLLRGHTSPMLTSVGRPMLESATAPLTALNLAQPGWDKAMGQRLVMMASNGLESAELRLDPPQLGSIQVKLAMQGDQAQLLMQVANPAAREALEAALPRLRELLGEEGLQLEHAEVSERDAGEQRRSPEEQAAQNRDADGQASSIDEQTATANVETLTLGSGRIYERV